MNCTFSTPIGQKSLATKGYHPFRHVGACRRCVRLHLVTSLIQSRTTKVDAPPEALWKPLADAPTGVSRLQLDVVLMLDALGDRHEAGS